MGEAMSNDFLDQVGRHGAQGDPATGSFLPHETPVGAVTLDEALDALRHVLLAFPELWRGYATMMQCHTLRTAKEVLERAGRAL